MDDIILIENNTMEMTKLKTKLAAEFEIKDLGHLCYFLGMEVARNEKRETRKKYQSLQENMSWIC